MPDRRSIFRLFALAGFLLTVALALWLAELRPLVVVVVMAVALLVAWTVEWLLWRQDLLRLGLDAVETGAGGAAVAAIPPPLAPPEPEKAEEAPALPPAEVEEPAPVEASTRVEPQPVAASPPAAPEPEPEPEPPASASARPALRPVPTPPPPTRTSPPQPGPRPTPVARDVINLRTRVTAQPRRWNLWDLERRARDEAQRDPVRHEEWTYLFVHLRQFATPDGSLPTEFDGLVRESFGELLDHAGR